MLVFEPHRKVLSSALMHACANTCWKSSRSAWHVSKQMSQEVFTIRNDIALWQTTLCPCSMKVTTIMQPFRCHLQPQGPKHPSTARTHAHTQTHPKQLEATVTVWEPKNVPATASHTNCPWLPAAATLAGKKHNVSRSGFLPTASSMQQSCSVKMQCFAASPDRRACMLRLPLHNKPHATGMQPFCSITWQVYAHGNKT